MDESDRSRNDDWIREWIEQQRILLQQRAAQQPTGAADGIRQHAADLGSKWLELGQSYLTGLQQFAQTVGQTAGAAAGSSVPGGAGLKLGEDFLGAWRAQWQSASKAASPAAAAGNWSELPGQLPPIGLTREYNAMLRELASAQAECQRLEQAVRTMLIGVQAEALTLLEKRLRERQPGQGVAGFRELYDLWVECGEQVYAQIAHSEPYCQLQAQLGNATMQLRARQQKLIEHTLKQFDLPTRSELNSVHRQLRDQARLVRELKEQVVALQAAAAGTGQPTPQAAPQAASARTSTRRKRKSS